MDSLNKVLGFLLMVLLLGVAVAVDLLAYIKLGGEFVYVGIFVLGALFVLGTFLFGSWVGSLFSLTLFSLTLLTGIIGFPLLLSSQNELLLGMLLFAGIFGFIASLLLGCGCCTSCRSHKRSCCKKAEKTVSWNVPYASPMPFPMPMKADKKTPVSTYNIESPELDAAALESYSNVDADLNENDFVELDEIEKLMETKMATKKGNGKKRKK